MSFSAIYSFIHTMVQNNMGVAAKMKEYGGMRAIGISNRQLVKMIIAEAGTYGISGVILGCIIGLPMHWVIFLFTSFLAVRVPAKQLQRMSIVENISVQ